MLTNIIIATQRSLLILVLTIFAAAAWAEDDDFCLDQLYGDVGPTEYRETGRDAQLVGEIEQIMAMGPDGRTGCGYYLKGTVAGEAQQRHYTLVFGEDAPNNLPTGTRVVLHGKLNGGVLSLRSARNPSSLRVTAAAPPVPQATAITVTVILVNFLDSTMSVTPAQIDGMVNANASSLARYYDDTSFGKLSVTGVIKGPYTINRNGLGSCDYAVWAADADAAAGVSSGYRMYVLAPSGCGWGGLGYLPGQQCWINSSVWTWQDTYCHEFGHNIGMHHARAGGGEYGDHSDCMGNPANPPHTNAPHTVYMGWMPPANIAAITAHGTYTYTLAALESNLAATQVIKLPKSDSGEDYYISYRAPIGLDATNLEASYQLKTSVHSFTMGWNYTNLQGVLGDGETYSDSANQVTVTQDSHTATTATITVRYGVTGSNHAPVITASADATPNPATAGQQVSFTVAASDADGDALTYAWDFGDSANGAGASTSHAYAAAGSYAAVVTVGDGNGGATSSAVSVTVHPAPAAPTITSAPANQTVTVGQTATFSVVAAGSAPLSYSWQRNGSTIAGATGSSYTSPPAAAADSGATFRVIVGNAGGSAASASATLTVSVPARAEEAGGAHRCGIGAGIALLGLASFFLRRRSLGRNPA